MDVELNCFCPSKPALNKENSALLFTNVYYTPGIRGANQLHVLKTDGAHLAVISGSLQQA